MTSPVRRATFPRVMTGVDRRIFELERRLIESQRMMEAERDAEIQRMREAQEAAAAEAAAAAAANSGGAGEGTPEEVLQWAPKDHGPLRSAWIGRPSISGWTAFGDAALTLGELEIDIGEAGLDQGTFSAWRLVVFAQWEIRSAGDQTQPGGEVAGDVWFEGPGDGRFATAGWSVPNHHPDFSDFTKHNRSGTLVGVWDFTEPVGMQRFRLVAGPASLGNGVVYTWAIAEANTPLIVGISATPGGPNWAAAT